MMPRKIYFKVVDLFIREFNWPEKLLRFPNEKLKFNFDYNSILSENLKSLKKKFNLTESEIKNLKNSYSVQYLVHRLEKCGYEKGQVSKAYEHIFPPAAKDYFSSSVNFLLNKIELENSRFDNDNYSYQRIYMNLLLGISFEYACKALLLHRNYCINECKTDSTLILEQEDKNQCIKSRTVNLEIAWSFILSKKLISLKKEEKSMGAYLLFCRNVQSHVPMLMAARGTYVDKSIQLIKKIIEEIHSTDLFKKDLEEFTKMFKKNEIKKKQ